MTYTGGARHGCGCAYFRIKILEHGEYVASVSGQPMQDVQHNETVSVELIPDGRNLTNSYRFPEGPYTYAFTADKLVLG